MKKILAHHTFSDKLTMSYPDGLESIIGEEPLFITLAEYESLKGYLCLTKTCLVTVSLDITPVVINVCSFVLQS